MKKKIVKFRPGTITLYDKDSDTEFGGSLFLKNQESAIAENYPEEKVEDEIIKNEFLKSVDNHLRQISDNISKTILVCSWKMLRDRQVKIFLRSIWS